MRIFILTATYELCVSRKIHLRDHPSVCSLSRKQLEASVSLPPYQRGGTHSPTKGGGPDSDDWRKSLVLCLLCAPPTSYDLQYMLRIGIHLK
jgi:hypothetical protein